MQLSYKYKIKPDKQQLETFDFTLELCRKQYNYRLAERLNWFEYTRNFVDRCPLTCAITPIDNIFENIPETRTQSRDGRKKDANGNPITKKGDVQPNIVNGYVEWQTVQLADITNTKKLFPEYNKLYSQVLQDVVNRVDYAFQRYTVPDKNGKRSGKPKFKGKHYYNSFTYSQLTTDNIIIDETKTFVKLSKIGNIELVYHRPIPDGFIVKTGTVIREADGWYVCFTLEDKRIPQEVAAIQPTKENSKGIDLGLNHYVVTSDNEFVAPPKFLRRSQKKLAKLQQRLDKHTKGSKPWRVLKYKIAKLHQKIARQRLDWQFNLAYQLFENCDVIFCEDLELKNLIRRCKSKIDENGNFVENGQSAKSGLNKSLLDAAFGQFVKVLEFVAWKLGKIVRKIAPKGTSQTCHECLHHVPKKLKDRIHLCPNCGADLDRDYNSALLIKKIGIHDYEQELNNSVETGLTSLKKARKRRKP